MKIHELIGEDVKTDEAFTSKALDYAAHGIGKYGGKALDYIGSKIAPKVAQNIKTIGRAGPTALRIAKLGENSLALLKYLGLGSFVYDYYTAVEAGEAKVKKGEWTEEQFQDFRQGEMTKLVLAIGTSTVFFTAIKIFSGFSIFIRLMKLAKSPAIQAFAVVLNSLSETVRVAFIAFLVSPKGKQAREDIGDLIGRGIIDNTLGGNGVALVDKVKHWLDSSHPDGKFKNPLDPNKPGTTDPEAEANKVDPNKDTPTPANPTTVKKVDTDSDYDYDKSKYTRNADGGLVPKIKIGN
jgi:hypothetical protein